ncbi:MAG: hypothetical protein FWG20_02015, partial [Candidatus Cloacimonetes bacterium]|nr:hypothetical protein [Candidatus Cloacimonadota bacterium]
MAFLSQEEAIMLINMLKKSVIETISFPAKGKKEIFNVIGDCKDDLFEISIHRGSKRADKCSYQGRHPGFKANLMRLDVDENSRHINP